MSTISNYNRYTIRELEDMYDPLYAYSCHYSYHVKNKAILKAMKRKRSTIVTE